MLRSRGSPNGRTGAERSGGWVELGLTASAVRNWVERGRLHRVHSGVYAVGHPLLTSKGRAMAAVWGGGRGAVLPPRAAGDLRGLRPSSAKRVEARVHSSRSRHKDIA